jgi:RNA polymerase sigma factor (sigma-70 family)
VTPDIELYDAWARGDRRAGNELIERYYDRIHRFFANKVGVEAEDLAQETFAGVLAAHPRFERRSSFRTFLYAIAFNVLRTHIARKNRAKVDPDFSVQSIAELCPTPSTMARQSEETEQLHAALRGLPVDHQVVLELYYWEDLSGPELTEVLGLTLPAVRSRLRRAKEALEQALGELAAPLVALRPDA